MAHGPLVDLKIYKKRHRNRIFLNESLGINLCLMTHLKKFYQLCYKNNVHVYI